MANRTPRKKDTRENAEHPEAWTPLSNLPEPDFEANEGWEFRWIRTSMMGEADNRNVSKRFREGWVPAKREDHPEFEHVLSDHGSSWEEKGCIEVGGLLLCKIPTERADARRRYYENMAAAQMDGVNQTLMANNSSAMPIYREHKSTSGGFGSGTP